MSLVIIQIKFIWGNPIGMNLQNPGLKLSRSRNYQPVSVFIQRQGEGSKRKMGSMGVRIWYTDSGFGFGSGLGQGLESNRWMRQGS